MEKRVPKLLQKGIEAAKAAVNAWENEECDEGDFDRLLAVAERNLVRYASPDQADATPDAAYYLGRLAYIQGAYDLYLGVEIGTEESTRRILGHFDAAEKYLKDAANWSTTDMPNPISLDAMLELSKLYRAIPMAGGPEREEEANALLEKAAKGGSLIAMLGVATMKVLIGTTPKDVQFAQDMMVKLDARRSELSPVQIKVLDETYEQYEIKHQRLQRCMSVAQGAARLLVPQGEKAMMQRPLRIGRRVASTVPVYH